VGWQKFALATGSLACANVGTVGPALGPSVLRSESGASINGTRGAERLLMHSGMPAPVPHGLVERLADVDADVGIEKITRRRHSPLRR
jgi:hypothetical protein